MEQRRIRNLTRNRHPVLLHVATNLPKLPVIAEAKKQLPPRPLLLRKPNKQITLIKTLLRRGFLFYITFAPNTNPMTNTSELEYIGDLQIRATHVKSGQTFVTDAPVDNNGKGSAFSPTDLLASSLGLCMMTIMGIAANTNGFSIDGTKARVTKIMASDPRRVSEIIVELDFPPNNYTKREKQIIRQCAKICPVAQSLKAELMQRVVFNF